MLRLFAFRGPLSIFDFFFAKKWLRNKSKIFHYETEKMQAKYLKINYL
jgi:hypothetical protein